MLRSLPVNFKRQAPSNHARMIEYPYIVKRDAADRKIFVYMSGSYLSDLDLWWMDLAGEQVLSLLNQPCFATWTKRVYIRLSTPNTPLQFRQEGLALISDMTTLSRYAHHDRENIQVFAHCPLCRTLGRIRTAEGGCPRIWGNRMCEGCRSSLFSYSDTEDEDL